MTQLTDWVLRHRLVVGIAWLAVAAVGGLTASTTVDRLSYEFALPGAPAYETNERIMDEYGGGGTNPPLLVVLTGDGAAKAAPQISKAVEGAIAKSRTVTASDPGAESLTADNGQTSTVVVYPPVVGGPEPYASAQPQLEGVVEKTLATGAPEGSVDGQVTGFSILSEGGGGDRGVIVEVLLGGLGALVVLALVFGSLLAGLPLLVAAVSILGTYLALLGLTQVTDVSFVVQYLVALIGLGVAIDYSLLVVTRWREESARSNGDGREGRAANDDAIRTAMATAGRSVLFSGVTVAVSLASLILVPLPFLRSIGLGGLLIPLLSVATSLTLVPALLSAFGPRLVWPRRKPARTRSPMWNRIATSVLRHRWVTIVVTTVALLALAAPVVWLTLGSPQLAGLASEAPESTAATRAIDAGAPDGTLRPIEVLVPEGEADAAGKRLERVDGVSTVVSPEGDAWARGDERMLLVWLADDPASDNGRAALADVRATEVGEFGGGPTEDADFVTAVYENVVWVVLAVVLVTSLLLARALRSLWLPIKALVLNTVSIAAAYGVTVLIWQEGFGSELLFNQAATGVITTWVPIAAFAFLFGLSMDYEVFILSRVREAYDDHGDTDRAVVDGIAYTGRLVTSAALILFLAFIALSTVPAVEVKILATALALGIAIDAVIVRSLLAPALVGVLGRANWTMPSWLSRLLRT